MSQEALLALWHAHHDNGDTEARDQLVLSLAPIVKCIVYRKIREIPVHREVDDFISCGLEALIRSIDRYDPARGATIEQFVWTRIHGAVLDELRRFDWAPRSLRRIERDLNQARDRFSVLYGRAPTRTELSEMMAISAAELTKALDDIARAEVGSLNALVGSDDEGLSERVDTVTSADASCDPERAAMRESALARFRDAFQQLPIRERKVAVMLHVNDLTLRETGELLGVSESRVCQIHGSLKRGLREHLQDDEALLLEVA